MIGNPVRKCEGDGWWSGVHPICVKELFCENDPPVIANAIPNIQIGKQSSKYKVETEVEYQCDIGYSPTTTSNKIICLKDEGKWSKTDFTCRSILLN
jgi:hypothetical protein